jgi:diaminopimelate decarboxylase
MSAEPSMDDLLSLFPPGSTVDGDGMLLLGGCRAADLAKEHGTPVLVVVEEAPRAGPRVR